MPKIEKLLKKQEDGSRKVFFPATVIQAIRNGKGGATLESILAQFNSIYVQFNGTAFDTRNLIPSNMRRAGLVITYMNMEGETISERAVSAVQAENDHWGLDINWTRIDEFSLSGRITISSNGTWLVDGEDTGIKAVGPKGDTGLTPWLKTIDNKLHFSYDNVTWEPCSENIAHWFRVEGNKLQISSDNTNWETVSDYIAAYFRFSATSSDSQGAIIGRIQISRDNKTWQDLSPEFRNDLRIRGYVATTSALPSGQAVGTIYGVGPTYATEDTAQTNPIYRLHVWNGTSWVDNGQFTSIAAGVVQETGDSETEVMSQKAVTEILSELGSKASVFNVNNFVDPTDTNTTYTLQEAVNLVPTEDRSLVKVLLYRAVDGGKIAIFNGNSYVSGFTNINYWSIVNETDYYNSQSKGYVFLYKIINTQIVEVNRAIRKIMFKPPTGKETHEFAIRLIPKDGETYKAFYIYDMTSSNQASFPYDETYPLTGVHEAIISSDGRSGWEDALLYFDIDFTKLSTLYYPTVEGLFFKLNNYSKDSMVFKYPEDYADIDNRLSIKKKLDIDITDGYYSNGVSITQNAEWRVIEYDIVNAKKWHWASGSVRPSATRLVDYLNNNGGYISSECKGTGVLTYYEKFKLTVPSNAAKIRITSYINDEPELFVAESTDLDSIREELNGEIKKVGESVNSANYWTGKTIWWCGTSIPAGSDATLGSEETVAGMYPKQVGENLGATVYNEAVGGSMCRANVRTGDYNGANISNITSALSMTDEEVESFITNYDTLKQLPWNSAWADALSASDLNRLRAASFEKKLLPYLNGEKIFPDLFVIDHGHNDWKYKKSDGTSDITLEPTVENIQSGELAEDTYMTANDNANLEKFFGSLANIPSDKKDAFIASVNRNCYIGSVNFIVTLILRYNPHARIVFISNYEFENGDGPSYAPIIDAQESLAKSWAFPLCEVYKYLGFSNHIIPNSMNWFNSEYPSVTSATSDVTCFRAYNPDKVHPHSDISGDANKNYAGVISEFIKTCR